MSESIGKPWIEASVVEILVDHAHELPSPAQLQGRAQIIKDTKDGRQPRDRDTPLWAEITDSEYIIPVRIANEATNRLEDEYKRALTYYRRGFFTLKAAVSFDFVVTQVGNQMKPSHMKQIFLDIVELQYISGGGEGAPMATRAVALRTPHAFDKWIAGLRTGGTRIQAEEKFLRDSSRASKANSRRSNATNASKRSSKAPIKTSAQSVTPQPSIGNLAAKREWQESWFGVSVKRPKCHGVDYIPHSGGFEPTSEQKMAFEVILGEFKLKATTFQLTPRWVDSKQSGSRWLPMNMSSSSSIPDRSSGLPTSIVRSSQVIRSSQVVSSTPIDAHPTRNQTTASQLVIEPAHGSVKHSSDAESNEDSGSEQDVPIRSRQTSNRTDRTGQMPTPRPSDQHADESHQEACIAVEDRAQSLEADDAIIEELLSQADPVSELSFGGQQRIAQVRYSSPWDCEDELSSEHDGLHSPEETRNSPTKGKRPHSPALFSSTQLILNAADQEAASSQHLGQVPSNAKHQTSSGRGESQHGAAASLPSPPPEHSKGQKSLMQNLESVLSRRTNEPVSPTPALSHPRDAILQRTSKDSPNEQQEEPFGTRPIDKHTSRKRRLSQSQADDTLDAGLSPESAASVGRRPATENKRQRLDSQSKNAPHQLKVAQGTLTNTAVVSPNMTKPTTFDNGSGGVIPHNHDAWANPSWMNNTSASSQTGPTSTSYLRAADVQSLDNLQSRRISQARSGLRILQPHLHSSSRIPECAPASEHTHITASQFADADEDSLAPLVNSKVIPYKNMRLANKPVTLVSKTGGIIQSKRIIRGQRAVSAPGSSKQLRTSNRDGNSTGMAQEPQSTVRHGTRTSEGQQKEEKNRRSTLSTSNPRRTSKVHLDGSEASTVRPATTAHQSYLGGFQPSVTVNLPRKYQWTWERRRVLYCNLPPMCTAYIISHGTDTLANDSQSQGGPSATTNDDLPKNFPTFQAYALDMTDKVSDNPATGVEHSIQPQVAVRDEPVALSFPAILRNPNFAHLNAHSVAQRQAAGEISSTKKKDPRDKDGKRRIRRLENSKFSFNPHIVQPTKRDFAIPVARAQPTFPAPLPPYLPRVSSAPSAVAPASDPTSTFAGKFSHSLRGARRVLRRRRGQAEPLVHAIEAELCEWLAEPGKPSDVDDYVIVSGIREVRRSPTELVWDVDQDSFARYIVHCAARKEEPDGTRLTHLLRPNSTRPDRMTLATPPTTDWDTSSATGFSAFATDASEAESLADGDNESIQDDDRTELSSIASVDEVPPPLRVAVPGFRARSNSEAGYEHEGDESGDDTWVSLHHSVASLSLVAEEDPDRTVRTGRPTIVRELSRESSRSPSRRPHARPKRRAVRPIQRAHTVPITTQKDTNAGSLWEYLFA
ncbi:hypothetical protein AG1IA_06649 [Rhizoctonia solani AG-1 IA]|uniref:Uncharacterized protein n=1 Tax=Thanatephorus cucumeris (strain AG1-IA) TaxID=983506 RepID=L8WSH6_THACA|nr:hypothetical protein AG1IA_06649 [Rhizoctonia solani AG-1 IA]